MATDAKQEELPKPPEEASAAGDPPSDEAAKPAENQPGEGNSNDSPNAESGRSKLVSILRFAMIGFVPLIAIIASAIAGFAVSASRASQAQLNNVSSQLKNANAALSASKTEIANLKALVVNLNAKREKDQSNQEALTRQIVQNVSRLQVKAKISPTLEEQLQQAASSHAGAPPIAGVKTTTSAAAAEVPGKNSPKAQAIKEAIETFNKNGSRNR